MPLRHDAIYAYLLGTQSCQCLRFGWHPHLVAEASSGRSTSKSKLAYAHNWTALGSICGHVPAARRLSCGHIKYHILWNQKTLSRHSKHVNSMPPT